MESNDKENTSSRAAAATGAEGLRSGNLLLYLRDDLRSLRSITKGTKVTLVPPPSLIPSPNKLEEKSAKMLTNRFNGTLNQIKETIPQKEIEILEDRLCDLCGSVVKAGDSLEDHICDQYKCDYCDRLFIGQSVLEQHKLICDDIEKQLESLFETKAESNNNSGDKVRLVIGPGPPPPTTTNTAVVEEFKIPAIPVKNPEPNSAMVWQVKTTTPLKTSPRKPVAPVRSVEPVKKLRNSTKVKSPTVINHRGSSSVKSPGSENVSPKSLKVGARRRGRPKKTVIAETAIARRPKKTIVTKKTEEDPDWKTDSSPPSSDVDEKFSGHRSELESTESEEEEEGLNKTKKSIRVNNHICEICQKGFQQYLAYVDHCILHASQDSHKCDKCDASFNRPMELHRHKIQTHRNIYQPEVRRNPNRHSSVMDKFFGFA